MAIDRASPVGTDPIPEDRAPLVEVKVVRRGDDCIAIEGRYEGHVVWSPMLVGKRKPMLRLAGLIQRAGQPKPPAKT